MHLDASKKYQFVLESLGGGKKVDFVIKSGIKLEQNGGTEESVPEPRNDENGNNKQHSYRAEKKK